MDSGIPVDEVFFDFSKAFDKVSHKKLLVKNILVLVEMSKSKSKSKSKFIYFAQYIYRIEIKYIILIQIITLYTFLKLISRKLLCARVQST